MSLCFQMRNLKHRAVRWLHHDSQLVLADTQDSYSSGIPANSMSFHQIHNSGKKKRIPWEEIKGPSPYLISHFLPAKFLLTYSELS